jgi:hypothetical protein
MKVCTHCYARLPANTYFFYKKKGSADGLSPWCKSCHKWKSTLRKENTKKNAKKTF